MASKGKESLDKFMKTHAKLCCSYNAKEIDILNKVLNCQYNNLLKDLDRLEELENENELLKEIIRSFFDRGCPLHQYIDKDFGLAIEVDNECSTMILGEFKGVDLDKKLKEVLEDDK